MSGRRGSRGRWRSVLRGGAGSFERVVERVHNSPRPPLPNKPLRVGARAMVVETLRVVGGCVAGSCAHLLRWEMELTFLVLKPFARSLSRKLCHLSLHFS